MMAPCNTAYESDRPGATPSGRKTSNRMAKLLLRPVPQLYAVAISHATNGPWTQHSTQPSGIRAR
jgi:hypothetical protein